MYDIKELTMQEHKNAERQEFVGILMSGKINPKLYASYLYNQLQCYAELEKYGLANGLFRQTPGLVRSEKIFNDYKSLWEDLENPPVITKSTNEYVEHIQTIQDQAEKLYAHIYVRHMGDLRGGQMIRKKVPGKGLYYEFSSKEHKVYPTTIKETINSYLNTYQINVLPEAKLCFRYATELFKEMNDLGKTYKV